jgi:hypothetical protein
MLRACLSRSLLTVILGCAMAPGALAQDGGGIGGWFSGDWYLKVRRGWLHRAEIRGRRRL